MVSDGQKNTFIINRINAYIIGIKTKVVNLCKHIAQLFDTNYNICGIILKGERIRINLIRVILRQDYFENGF